MKMSSVKDICRICVQEVDNNEVELIDLVKLGRLINKSLVPKWHGKLFENHVICNTCIDNFRTLRNLYKLSWSSNALLMRHRRTMKSQLIDLKELKQHNKLRSKQEHFLLCRLCFEPTKRAAVYLFGSPHNIVPLEYINSMIKHVHLYLTMLENTISPILCFNCWQRIQVAFAFRKHLDTISEKVLHYQKLLDKSYLDREDLQDVFYMLDKLGVHPSLDSETSNSEEELLVDQNTSPGYIFFEEHNYFKKNCSDPRSPTMPILNEETCKTTPAISSDHMPILTPNIEVNTKEFKQSEVSTRILRTRNKPVPSLTHNKNKIMINNKKKLSKAKASKKTNKSLVNGVSMEVSSLPKNKQKLVSMLKTKMELQQQQNITWPDTVQISNEMLRPRTRLSAKKEKSLESPPSQDLLVLRKEEIIKKKPLRNPIKPLKPQHTSTPKVKENSQVGITKNKQLPTKQTGIIEYTFERLNFDNEVQNEKNTSEEADVEVKKEVISDSDDDFTENGKQDIMEVHDDDEACPNLDVFIKTEPEEIMDVNDDDDIDEPPELEFQGPCSYDPHFTISNTFTVSDKRHLVTLDEKRDLVNSLGESPLKNLEKAVLSSQNGPSINDKLPFLKVKSDAKLYEKSLLKEMVINLVKCPLEEQVLKASIANAHNKSADIKPKPEAPSIKLHYAPTAPHRKSLAECDSKAPRNKEVTRQSEPQIPTLQPAASFEDIKSPKYKDLFPNKTATLALVEPLVEPLTNSTKNESSPSTRNKKSDKSHWDLSLINQYNEVDLTVSCKNPFECKLCDFRTTSKMGAKCHLTLHSTDAASFHYCKLCSYHTTNKTNLKIHCSKAHSGNRTIRIDYCSYCHLGNAKLTCVDCNQFFHPKCVLGDQTVNPGKCLHGNMVGSVQILRNKSVILSREQRVIECNYCKTLVRNWVNCKTCSNYFHYNCFYSSRNSVGAACSHYFLYVPRAAQLRKILPKVPVDDKPVEQKRGCDFCGDALDSVIPCPVCFKFMHNACFQKDSKVMKFNCKHKDVIGEVSVVAAKCAYCQKPVEHNSVTCKLCNRLLHRFCFVVDRIKKTLNCQHTADIVLTDTGTGLSPPEAVLETPLPLQCLSSRSRLLLGKSSRI